MTDAPVKLIRSMPRAVLNTQLLKMRASFGKGAEEEEEEEVGGYSLANYRVRLQGEFPQTRRKGEDPIRVGMDGLGIHVKDSWINVVKGIEEAPFRHGNRDIERSSSPSEKGILFTEVGGPGLEVIGGNLHGKGIVDELLATHSTQVTACLGEVDEVFSAASREDAREKFGRKGFKSGMR
jgi:hypothetical protein